MTEKRTGPGRPRLYSNEKTKPYTISLTPAEAETIRELGGGNLTEGIRKAIDTMTTINRRNELINKIAERIHAAQWTDAQIEKQNSYGWSVDIRFKNAEYTGSDEWSHFDNIHLDSAELAEAKRLAAELEATL